MAEEESTSPGVAPTDDERATIERWEKNPKLKRLLRRVMADFPPKKPPKRGSVL